MGSLITGSPVADVLIAAGTALAAILGAILMRARNGPPKPGTPDAVVAALAANTAATEKLVALMAADKLIYATGSDTLATSDLTAFARTLLAANDLSAIWALLYLGSLAGKSKISVPGDIDAGGSAGSWSVLYGDGNWGPSPVAIANANPGVPRIVDAALSTTVTSAGQDWVAARMIARGAWRYRNAGFRGPGFGRNQCLRHHNCGQQPDACQCGWND